MVYGDSPLSVVFYAVAKSKRYVRAPSPTQRESGPEVRSDSEMRSRVHTEETAPMIGSWIKACFPGGIPTSKAGIEELIAEAAEAARNDFGVDAANE